METAVDAKRLAGYEIESMSTCTAYRSHPRRPNGRVARPFDCGVFSIVVPSGARIGPGAIAFTRTHRWPTERERLRQPDHCGAARRATEDSLLARRPLAATQSEKLMIRPPPAARM
jgi:hypothetical protein